MMISLAAAQADFTKFNWYSAKAEFTLKLDAQHPLKVAVDDLIGLNKATRGPTAGKYQVVLAKYPQLTFRAIDPSKITQFADKLKPYKGIPEKPEKTGVRQKRLVKASIGKDDKLNAQFFKAPSAPKEHNGYDRNDYQWRELVRSTVIKTRHLGKARATLQKGEIIGMRYLRKSHGGYVIMPNEERIMIDHDLYENLTKDTNILPHADQRKGLVAWDALAAKLPNARVRPQKYKVPMVDKEGNPIPIKTFVEENKPLVSEFDYTDLNDEDFEFDDEEADESELEFDSEDTQETVNHPEDDHAHDVAYDEEGEEVDDDEAIYAKEGRVLISKDNSEWVIVAVEESGLSDNLLLYSEEQNKVRHYKVPAGEDLRELKAVTVGGKVKRAKLEKLTQRALELAPEMGKRM